MKILLSGGGSGGHILPNIALIKKLKEEQRRTPLALCYIGEIGGMEEELVRATNIQFYGIYAGKLRRYLSFQNVLDIFKIIAGFFQAFYFIAKESPDVIFSKGGYVSFPVVFAGWCLGKRIIIHESDVVPGLTTRMTSKFATTVCVSWEKSLQFFKTGKAKLTGIPVREGLIDGIKEEGRKLAGIEKNDLPVLLVLGGSLGAKAINDFLASHLDYLLEHWNIVHVVGKGKRFTVHLQKRYENRYSQIEFVGEEIKDLFAYSDVILSRAGSTALAEYEYLEKPVLMIPLPRSSSRGDQFDNAEEYFRRHPNVSSVLEQDRLTLPRVEEELGRIIKGNDTNYEKTNAVSAITTIIVG